MASDSDSDSDSDGLGGVLRQLSCRLCRRYFRDPVITGCGHSFCRVCISRYWKRCRGSFRCPKCRVPFPEIRLRPNRQLRNAVERAERLAARPWTRRKRQRGPVEELLIERSPEGEPGRKRRRSGFPLTEAAPSMCPEHGEPLELFCSQDQRPVCVICRDLPQHWGRDFLPLRNGIQQYQKKCVARMKTLRKEREKLRRSKAMGKKYLKQTQDKRQKVVAEYQQQQHHFLEEQERLLLAQLQKPDEELMKHQTQRGRKCLEQISRLSERIRELEGKCQKPASEFQQDIRSTLSRCEEGQAQQPEEMAIELEEQVQDFSQQTAALSESPRVFTGTLPDALEAQSGDPLGVHSPANVTLDPETAHPQLVLLEDGKRVGQGQTWQQRPDTSKRFDIRPCVLGRESFTSGRHCWEVEMRGRFWAVGVARESVSRKGQISLNPKGGIWAVRRWWNEFQALTVPVTPLSLSPPSRIRVCLDCDQGQVTFIDAGTEVSIFTFPLCSLPGERIRPWFWVKDTNTELRL